MVNELVVARNVVLNASPARVWEALTHPGMTRHYMYNCEVTSDWKQGSSLRWSGSNNGRAIDESGEIIDIVPGRLLKYSGFDKLADSDISRDGNIFITHELIPYGNKTKLLTTLEHFEGDESRAEYVAQQWDVEILPKLQSLLETTL